MRLSILALMLLLALSSTAFSEPGFIVDSTSRSELILDPSLLALPEGQVLALEHGRIHAVDATGLAQVHELLALQLFGPDGFSFEPRGALISPHRASVYAEQLNVSYKLEGQQRHFASDVVVQVCDFSKDDDDTDGPDDVQAEKLARGRRFMMGDLELVIYAPGFASFKAILSRTTVPAPVLSPPLPGTSPAIPQVLARPAPVHEQVGWIAGSL